MQNDSNGNRKLRICVYGGTDLDEVEAQLVAALTQRILESMDAVIVTGGFSGLRTLLSNAARRIVQRSTVA